MIIGLIISILVLVLMAVSNGSSVLYALHWESLFFLLLMMLAFLLNTRSLKTCINSFHPNKEIDKKEVLKLNKYMIIVVILGSLLLYAFNRIWLYASLSDPTSIGSIMGSGLSIIIFGGIIILFVLLPHRYNIEKR